MNVGELCNREVILAYRDTRLVEVARLMREHHVGSLVVVVDRLSERVPVGILTDRDIGVAVVAKELDPRTLTASEVRNVVEGVHDGGWRTAIARLPGSVVRSIPLSWVPSQWLDS